VTKIWAASKVLEANMSTLCRLPDCSPRGNGSIKGYLVRPVSADTRSETVSKLPGIIVVHENRGLNPHIEDIARWFALANFMAFAPDGLTSLGGYPGDDYKGGQMFNKIDKNKMSEDMVAAAMWLKSRPDCTGKIGATGFCYGGSTANMLAGRLGADLAAAAPFYGSPPTPEDTRKLRPRSWCIRGARHATGGDVASLRQGAERGERSA
jgi:carboxymethylenebutenolidase